MSATPLLLKVENLRRHHALPRESLFRAPGRLQVLDGVSFELEAGGALGQKYKVSIEYNPALKGQSPIRGGLYAMPAGKPGLWMYFARPQNLDAVLARARGNLGTQGNMVLANRIQDEVIVPLLKAPEKVTKFDRARGIPSPPPAQATPDAPRLRL